MTEKLFKTFEILRGHYNQAYANTQQSSAGGHDASPVAQRKKDLSIPSRDRISLCNTIADFLPFQTIREAQSFPSILSVSVEILLQACDDADAGVRLTAGEALNKVIKAFLDSNIGRVQVEFYKEIKKNGAARSLKAAMQRFADTCHMIRPQKCRPYLANLLPCLVKIAKRPEDQVQEALGYLMGKLCPILGKFMNEVDIKVLLKSFVPNLKLASAMARRTAASSLNYVCLNSRNPNRFYAWLLNILLGMIVPLTDDVNPILLLGVLLCFRHMIPKLGETGDSYSHAMKGSFGVNQPGTSDKTNDNGAENDDNNKLLKVYEVTMFCTKHSDHNIVNAALEALQQVLQTRAESLLNILLSPHGISPTVTNASSGIGAHFGSELSLDTIGTEAGDSGLEEDTQSSNEVRMKENFSEASLDSQTTSLRDSACDEISEISGSTEQQPEIMVEGEDSGSIETGEDEQDNEEDNGLVLPSSYTDAGYVNIDEADVNSTRRLTSLSSVSDIPDNENEQIDLAEMERMMSITSYDAQAAIERYFNIDAIACSGVPILHCVRLMCSFLLAGTPGTLLPDSRTRVSMKSLALSCLGHALAIYPEAFLARVMPDSENSDTAGENEDASGAIKRSDQSVRDCLLFADHFDQQLRGMVCNVAASYIKAAICVSGGNYDEWCLEISKKYSTDVLAFDRVLIVFKKIMDDDSSIALKMACAAAKGFISELLDSSYYAHGYEVLLKVLLYRDISYWLVKVELLELLASLDYRLVSFVKKRYDETQPENVYRTSEICGIQERCVDVIMHLLGDDDARVRQAAARAIVNIVGHLSFLVKQNDTHFASANLVLSFKETHGKLSFESKTFDVVVLLQKYKQLFSANLAFLVKEILHRLNYATTKFLMHGCCQALALLAETFPISQVPVAWQLLPQSKISVEPASRPLIGGRSLGPLRKLIFDDDVSVTVGPLALFYSLLTASWITLDLQAHQELLKLCINLLCGSAAPFVRQTAQERCESGITEDEEVFGSTRDERWPIFKDSQLNTYAAKLFQHTVKLLCICMHVIEQTNPTSSSSKLQISFPGKDKDKTIAIPTGSAASPAIPQTSSSPQVSSASSATTSPRRFLLHKSVHRRTHSDQVTPTSSGDKSPRRKNSDGSMPQGSAEGKSSTDSPQTNQDKAEKLGHFHTSPVMMKLFEVCKGAYNTYQVTAASKKGEKFVNFVRGVLDAFSLLLELSSFNEVVNTAEEFLDYLMSCVKLEPERGFLGVQQLLKSLFGTNVSSQPEIYTLPESTKHLFETRGDPTFAPENISKTEKFEKQPFECCSLYEDLFKRPFDRLLQSLRIGQPTETASELAKKNRPSALSFFKKFRKMSVTQKPASKLSKEKLSSIQSYIRLFEPLVIHALKTYTMTSSLDIQCQVIHVLDQLIRLRVNYSLLDADQIFFAFILKQFEFVEAGQISNPAMFIPEVFQLLVLLSYECFQPKKNQAKAIIIMPQIIQLCDGVMACGQPATTHAIPALRPVVQDLFISKNQARADSGKELDTQREVVFAMLLRLTQYPAVLELMTMVLEGSKDDNEKWKRYSRQIVDVVFPQLPKLQIHLEYEGSINVLNNLFDSLAPIALRPADDTLPETVRWFCMILGLHRILITQNNEDIMITRISHLGICKQSPAHIITLSENDDSQNCCMESFTKCDSAEFYACFFFHATKIACEQMAKYCNSTRCDKMLLTNLEYLTSQFLIMFSTMFTSPRFRDITLAASNHVKSWKSMDDSTIDKITSKGLQLKESNPLILLYWCHVLGLLEYDDQEWWKNLYRKENFGSNMKGTISKWNNRICQNGIFLIYCGNLADFYKLNTNKDASLLFSLLETNLDNLLQMSTEYPVAKLLSVIFEDSDLSGLFLQFVAQKCDKQSPECKCIESNSLLGLLEKIHRNQSGPLLHFFLKQLPRIRLHGIARFAETVACRRLEHTQSTSSKQHMMAKELLEFSSNERNAKRFPRLNTLIKRSLNKESKEEVESRLRSLSHPLDTVHLGLDEYIANKDWCVSFIRNVCSGINEKSPEEIDCCAVLLNTLDAQDMSEIIYRENNLTLVHQSLCLAIKSSMDRKSSYIEELTQSLTLLDSPKTQQNQMLLTTCKRFLLESVSSFTKDLLINKQINRVSFVEKDEASESYGMATEQHDSTTLGPQSFAVLCRNKVQRFSKDRKWRARSMLICRCIRDFLSPACYCNKHWKLSKEELSLLMEFAFLVLKICILSPIEDYTSMHLDLYSCLECLSLILHGREFWSLLTQESNAYLIANGINDVYQLVYSVAVNPGEKLSSDVFLPHDLVPYSAESSIFARCCHQVSEMVHALRTHFSSSNFTLLTVPVSSIRSLRQVIVGLARLPLVNSFVRIPPIVWRLGWHPDTEGPFNTELPPLPVEILKEKDVLMEFIFRANAIGWTSRAQFEETWAALLGVLSSPPMVEDTSVEEEIEAAQSSCLAVHCITSLLLDTTLAPLPGNPGFSRYSFIPRQKEYPFLGSRAGKRLEQIRKTIEMEYKRQCGVKNSESSISTDQFLYPVVPSLIFEKQRKQILQRDCFMEERLYSSNLEISHSLNKYVLGQISASTIRTRLVSSNVQEDSDSDDSEALIIQLNEEDPRKKFEELDIRSCLQFLLELFEQWLSPFINLKTPLMLKTEAVKSLCLLSDLLLEMSHFEWILGVLLEFYQNNPAEDDITTQYIVPTICKALAVLRVEGNIAERICRIIETALKSSHVPLQVSALGGALYLLESHVPSTNMVLVPILTDYLAKHIMQPIDAIQIISQRFCSCVWTTAFYVMEVCSTEIQDITFTTIVVETCIALLSSTEVQIPVNIAHLLFRGLERLVVSFTVNRANCDRLAKVAVHCLQSENHDQVISALGLLCTCMYTGKESQHVAGATDPAGNINSPIAESQLVMMERLVVLFTRIRKGTFSEASLVSKILPTMLLDFLPVQEIMNKVFSEFLSSQQPHPELIANIAFQVFDGLQRQGQQDAVRNWIILSLGSFIQRFPYVVSRKGKLDKEDRKLLCIVAVDFYQHQILEPEEKRMFLNTFQRKSSEVNVYRELVECCSRVDMNKSSLDA
eukprot:gene5415-6091_t